MHELILSNAMGSSPCLQPWPILIWEDMLSFGLVSLLKSCNRVDIQYIIVPQKPKSFKVDHSGTELVLVRLHLDSSIVKSPELLP